MDQNVFRWSRYKVVTLTCQRSCLYEYQQHIWKIIFISCNWLLHHGLLMMQLCFSPILLSPSPTFPDTSINFSVGRLSVDKLDKLVLHHMDPCSPMMFHHQATKPSLCVVQLLAPAVLWPQNHFQCQLAAAFFLNKKMAVFWGFFKKKSHSLSIFLQRLRGNLPKRWITLKMCH